MPDFVLDLFPRESLVVDATEQHSHSHHLNDHYGAIEDAVMTLLKGVDYTPTHHDEERRKLLFDALIAQFDKFVHSPGYDDMCSQAAAMAEVHSYHYLVRYTNLNGL
ncbi:hypothetical protein C0992_010859 [Termitomyces sp. T32_za158]|nr:hypothetical protein C0992_010859 [Termitomyces sp. T32_za158]